MEVPIPPRRRPSNGDRLVILGARHNNLKDLEVAFPLGLFTVVTGVSGSGKSSLVNDILYRALATHFYRAADKAGAHQGIEGLDELDKVIAIDQSPIGRTPRSNPATYTNVFGHIRNLMAKTPEARQRGYKPGRFSFNVKGGRCEACKGDGQIKIEMHFLPDIYVTCEVCGGRRYDRETLTVTLQGTEYRRDPRSVGRAGARCLPQHPGDRADSDHARRGRSGLYPSRPAGHDAVGRRGATGQARQGALQTVHGSNALSAGRADHRTAFRRCRQAAAAAAPADRSRQHRGRHRAQSGGHQDGRLAHRSRARGRRRWWLSGRRRPPREGGSSQEELHGSVLEADPRQEAHRRAHTPLSPFTLEALLSLPSPDSTAGSKQQPIESAR